MKKGISVLAMASLAILTISAANADNKFVDDAKKGADAVGNGAKKAGEATVNGAKKVGEATVSGAKKVGGGIKTGAEAVGNGAKKAGEATVGGAKKVGESVADHMPGHKPAATKPSTTSSGK